MERTYLTSQELREFSADLMAGLAHLQDDEPLPETWDALTRDWLTLLWDRLEEGGADLANN